MSDDPVRRIDEAQRKLQEQSYGMIVLTSGPTPISINDALGIFLADIRKILVKLEEEAVENEGISLEEVCPSRSVLDYLARLDFGHGDREDNPKLYDALATLRMVVG